MNKMLAYVNVRRNISARKEIRPSYRIRASLVISPEANLISIFSHSKWHNNQTSEVKEPPVKIQKVYENGVPEITCFLRVKKLSEKVVLLSRGSSLSAGYDLSSAAEVIVPCRGKTLIPTDLSIAVPEGTYARIAPRSGLTWKHSVDVGAGVIDVNYRGAVGVILFNHSDVDFQFKMGDRVAQLIIQKIITPVVEEAEDFDSTVRGSGGFGSTSYLRILDGSGNALNNIHIEWCINLVTPRYH
ncbi:deoxyuridine 5'-triphosphate nucleotidohydrolase-like [Papaver somniferum]|uniref:deoxyuridine 5'-triphosphate nucleotidohydrolase-like n=1 Tax=Papaver somniferum TaxID=3469 RepID=UPI000E6FE4CF|nr:deoxyuridine 5'-triphosphate nucleotidohydrolase-like [Papaver somniferum]